MVLDYDRNPSLTGDQKLESLIRNIQIALDEITLQITNLSKELEALSGGERSRT